ncbi:C-factor [Penicillium alfredii]|uniref:C-factor n=1 Tax=Penicillium alfredii TaxID=1506179 RepID=A0A9W9EMR7_9EURO|nr:C-factor [Penicillium alfredii]KAJ5084549.1 C-factor [Penicillium alfredii]
MPSPAYKITKAALNSLTVQYALDYKKEGFTIFAFAPGWLRTELGGDIAGLSIKQGAQASVEKILGTGKEQNGQFIIIKVKGWEKVEGRHQYHGGNVP